MMRVTLPAVALFSCIILCNAAAAAAPAHLYQHNGNASAEAAGVAEDWRLERRMPSLAKRACLYVMPKSTVTELKQCTSNFLASPSPREDVVSGAWWQPCRGVDTITVLGRQDVSGGEYRVDIVEDTTNISDTRDHFSKSNMTTVFNSTSPNTTYNLWVMTFDSSGRRFGVREVYVLRPRLHPLPVRAFNPPTQFQFQENDSKSGLMANMSWNMTEDYNCDYSAYYICGNGDTAPSDRPIFTRAGYPPSLRAHYLPFNTTCIVTIGSSLGTRETEADFNFTTPTCQRVRSPALCSPEPPSAVETEAEASGALTASGEHEYMVKVRWAAPEYPPQSYTVVIASVTGNYTASVQVDGNATEATVENAELSGYYHVLVTAVSQSGKTESSNVVQQLALPPKERRWVRQAAWATAACSVAALLLVTVLWWWRRVRAQRLLRRHRYFQELEENAAKEMSLGTELVYSADAFELRSDRVVLFDVLGEGAFGVVRKGWFSDKSKEVAVKMLKDSPTAEDVRQFRQEMEVMKSVGAHAHIVSLLGCVTTAHNMMIVVEYCARGDLLNYLRCAWEAIASKRLKVNNQEKKLVDKDNYIAKNAQNPPDVTLHNNIAVNKLYDLQGFTDSDLSTVDLLSFCRQIAMGMEFLSSNKVVHRDLAARNILVCADKTVKIADFGLSRDVYRDNHYRKTTNGKLPIKWMALESLTHQIYTTQSDVWSFGIVVWETVTLGGVPYPGLSASELLGRLRAGYRMPRPYNCTPKLYELMSSCWHEMPRKRPTFGDLHEQLDTLLSEESHKEYLEVEGSEEREDDEQHKVPPDKFFKYWKFIYRDGKSTSESSGGLTFYKQHIYPLKQAQSHHALLNHYSGTPTHYAPTQCTVTADQTTKSLI